MQNRIHKKNNTSVRDFISSQKIIRVVFIYSGGFGDMAASATVMARLRENEFGVTLHGFFE